MNRSARSKLAQETLQILERGFYKTASGNVVELTSLINQCLTESKYFDLDELEKLHIDVLKQPCKYQTTDISLANETTLEGAKTLTSSGQYQRVGVLNFASAKKPGGGFLVGSQAQEESLARSSALYKSLIQFTEYYESHRQIKAALYSDRMIYSPNCPVFRGDAGQLLDEVYQVDLITSAAPNAGAIRKNQPDTIHKIPASFKQRASKVLAIGCGKDCDALVLGAWGCGVFGNDPSMVATIFGELLLENKPYFGKFKHIRFSIFDRMDRKTTFKAFADVFSNVL